MAEKQRAGKATGRRAWPGMTEAEDVGAGSRYSSQMFSHLSSHVSLIGLPKSSGVLGEKAVLPSNHEIDIHAGAFFYHITNQLVIKFLNTWRHSLH